MLFSSGKRSSFFIFISVFYLGIAIVGFFPSFLRGVDTGLTTIPWIIHLHALAMMGWLTLVILQAWLVRQGKMWWHYGFAVCGFMLVALVWLTGMGLSTNTLFFEVPDHVKPIIYKLFGLTIAAVAQILVFYLAAMIAVRFSVHTHKRLILFVSFSILDAAFFRMLWLPGITGAAGPIWPLHLYHLLILAPLVWFDVRTLGRLHSATLAGLLLVMVLKLASVWAWNSDQWLEWAAAIEMAIGEWWTPLY
ncbi:hypothetical protein [Pseudidiomarina homiensis]|uniref:Uncharacterized protein n=1 Tax=Pseudidiomarina homiensis TaxID=364198 RepID=A0A432Y3S9_9GAMM|nr:hypothetical protein [Pseudidiomarina homiensis]RUO55561.1 hypothetical protein CWI70_01885 [Pseudidiomarina homiensis]